jgi:hypothetical protein
VLDLPGLSGVRHPWGAPLERAECPELGLPKESRGGIVLVGKISEQRRALEEE